MRFPLLTILLLGLPLVVPGPVMAETSPPAATATASTTTPGDDKPGRGMSMHQVQNKFGEPEKKLPATGKPPITRWIYQDFTVYFEGKYVIHAVTTRKDLPAR